MGVWQILYHDAAVEELGGLPVRERGAMLNAVEKLIALGPALPFPHQSNVRGAPEGLREVRPRSGRSPWRAFYRRVGDVLVIAAIGPEAEMDRRGFDRAVRTALARLQELEEAEGGTNS
jgi:hypothetical protein